LSNIFYNYNNGDYTSAWGPFMFTLNFLTQGFHVDIENNAGIDFDD